MDHKLFLLDGMALVYRAYFALQRSGVKSPAVFGFANTLVELITNQEPSHIAVVFDTAAPTERHDKFPEYKAQRQEMPEDLSVAIPHVKALIEAFNIPVITKDGFEADDIIGTLARHAREAEESFHTYMVTPDKDFAQLVNETTMMYKPGRQGDKAEILGLSEILEKWEIERPDQVIDILGMWGDASDNIPGIPGIGEKTAKKLVKQFGDIEGLLANTDQLKGKQKEKVEANMEQARMSRWLATINCEVPLDVSIADFIKREVDEEKLQAFMVEFRMNSLCKRMFGKELKDLRSEHSKKIEDVSHDYTLVADAAQRKTLLGQLEKQKAFCFDLETTGLDPQRCQVIGLAVSWEQHKAYYVQIPRGKEADILLEFKNLLEDPKTEKVGHHLKFDISVLSWKDIRVRGPIFDTMLAHMLVDDGTGDDEGLRTMPKMDYLSEIYLGYTPIAIKTLIGEKKGKEEQLNLLDVAEEKPEEVAEYAAEDADVTWQLYQKLKPMLEEKGQSRVCEDIESPLLPVLVAMEKEGIAVNIDALKEIGNDLASRAGKMQEQIFCIAGHEFNLDSPKQLGGVLFEELQLVEKAKKTKTGQYSTREEDLRPLAENHPIIQHIMDYREATKLKNTYVDALPNKISKKTGRIHTHFHQLLTVTGRLASSDPNLQNIPIRSEAGRQIRKAFVPRDGYTLLAADYSQIELRIMAELSKDDSMMSAFQKGQDIHTATAAKVYDVEALEDVTSDMRRTAKMVNFGIIYGISAFGLAQRLDITKTEAQEIIDAYFQQYPGVKTFMDETIARAKKDGYVETITGRRRYLRDIRSGNWTVRAAAERTAINTPIQGTAADMIKIAMVSVARQLEEEQARTRLLLQVHDELVFDLDPGEQLLVMPGIEQCMKNVFPEFKVPIVVDMGVGKNWLEAH